MREVRALNRAGRINQICLAILEYHRRTQVHEMTAYEIAHQIGMRPTSPAFRNHLKAAVEDAKIVCREVVTSRRGIVGGKMFLYSLAVGDQPKKRSIPVKTNGVVTGQLQLFERERLELPPIQIDLERW